MIALDTDVLAAAWRSKAPGHVRARAAVEEVLTQPGAWALPWPVVHELYSVLTGTPPNRMPPTAALEVLQTLTRHPDCVLLHEGPGHLDRLEGLVLRGDIRGGAIHDARIAAICLDNGVRELWTADRDFGRFPELRTRNPLVLPA